MWAELLWFVYGNFQIFVTMATGVGMTQITLTQLNRQTLKPPFLAQESRWHLTHKLSYSRFCDKIYQFLLPWQQGWLWQKFKWLRLIGQPPVWCKILGPILSASWVIVIFVYKFQNFRYRGNRGWSDTNFTHIVKSADPETPLFCARMLMISHTQAEL